MGGRLALSKTKDENGASPFITDGATLLVYPLPFQVMVFEARPGSAMIPLCGELYRLELGLLSSYEAETGLLWM